MKEYINDRGFCYFHPRELVLGVCALCVNERLLVLASRQQAHKSIRSTYNSQPKIFALTSFFNRLDIRQNKSDHQLPYYDDSSPSPEDSFISIKFEGNGVASWDKGQISKMSLDHQCGGTAEMSMNGKDTGKEAKQVKSVVEHSKPRSALRWRKRIGHLFQLIRWKRTTSKGNVSHVGTKIGSKVKYGWVKALTKRKTNQD